MYRPSPDLTAYPRVSSVLKIRKPEAFVNPSICAAAVSVRPCGDWLIICSACNHFSSAREKYSTPEKRAALIFADLHTKVSAIQVTRQKPLDAQHVALTIGSLSDKTIDVVMRLGPNGWQAMTADRKIFDQFKAKLGASAQPTPAVK